MRSLYDVVVLAYGCESDRKLGIPGEDLEGVYSAREFVSWYNGHPDYVHMGEKFQKVLHDPRNSSVVVVGQGNVALDCARILAKGRNGLNDTDIAKKTVNIAAEIPINNELKKVALNYSNTVLKNTIQSFLIPFFG